MDQTQPPAEQEPPRPGVALFVDWANLRLRLARQGIVLRADRLAALAREQGRLLRATVYCDAAAMPPQPLIELHSSGFVIVHCPRLPTPSGRDKESVDQVLIDDLYGVANWPGVREVLLATADRDFLPAMHHVRNVLDRRVRIVTATPDDRRRGLSDYSDGVVAYADQSESLGFADEAAESFAKGEFETTQPRLTTVLRTLAVAVRGIRDVMRLDTTPVRGSEITARAVGIPSVLHACRTPEAVEDRVDFLFAQHVLERTSGRGGKHYRLAATHPFVRHALRSDATE